jgi:hypothetical protein
MSFINDYYYCSSSSQIFKSGDAVTGLADVTTEGWTTSAAATRMPCLGGVAAALDTRRLCSAAAKKERARAAISLVNIFFVWMTRGEFSDLHWYYIILIFAARPQVAP